MPISCRGSPRQSRRARRFSSCRRRRKSAPCKTFATALANTSPGGEINCLDPGQFGSFGAVFITKAITISCETGTAGIPVGGSFRINAATTDVVTLRGLDIDG